MRALIDIGLNTIAKMTDTSARARKAKAQVIKVASDVRYADGYGSSRLLDVWKPRESTGPLPVLFYVHGGGFRILSKDSHRYFAYRFAAEGFLVVTINYRLTPAGTFPHALEDVCLALLWTLDHAEEYGGDTSQLFYAGDSAGANLSTALAICSSWKRSEPWARAVWDRNPAPVGILPACGIMQVSQPERYLERTDIPSWMRQRIEIVCRGYRPEPNDPDDLASPLCFLEAAGPPQRPFPAVFAPCGDEDPIADDTRRLGPALAALDIPNEIKFYEGGGHAFHAFPWSDRSELCWVDQFRFLNELTSG
jgi:acetyl esterase